MHSSTYFFTYVSRTITSYPHDYTHECFRYAIEKAKNSAQIVLVRRDNLLHYCYVRKIREKQYFGICFRTDHIYNSVADLFRAFDHVYTEIVYAGILLQVDTNGQVMVGTTEFAKESVEINEQSKHFLNSLRLSSLTTQQLPPADFSISIKDCIDLSIEQSTNSEIIDAIKKYNNVYIVKSQAEIARLTEVTSIIKRKNEEIRQLQDTIVQQDNAISDLKKSKNKYKWVLLLLAVILIGIIVFFIHNNAQNTTIYNQDTKILELRDSIIAQNDSIEFQNDVIDYLVDTFTLISIEKDTLEKRLNDSTEIIREQRLVLSKYPFLIQDIQIANVYDGGTIETNYGGTIYSKNSMRLKPKISYVGLVPGTKELGIKWYYPNGNLAICSNCNCPSAYTQCEDHDIQAGMHTLTTNAFGGKEKGHWNIGQHRIEIWCEGNKIAERTFYIY